VPTLAAAGAGTGAPFVSQSIMISPSVERRTSPSQTRAWERALRELVPPAHRWVPRLDADDDGLSWVDTVHELVPVAETPAQRPDRAGDAPAAQPVPAPDDPRNEPEGDEPMPGYGLGLALSLALAGKLRLPKRSDRKRRTKAGGL